MAKVTFDGVNSLIIVDPGITELDVQIDLYSDWKEWSLEDDNLKFLPAFRAVGGDPISDTRNLGITFFLINDWRIRPDEVDHRLVLSGNLFTDPAGFSPVVPTLGSFNVIVEYSTSNLVDATVSNIDVARTQFLIESVRGHHGSYGNVFFWDPVNGDDDNEGTTPDLAVQHFSAAHDLVVSGRHDVIFLMTGTIEIEWNEAIVITKRDVSLRGAGHGTIIKPSTAGIDAITLSAHGAHVQGIAVHTVPGGGDGIYIDAEFCLVEDCDVSNCSGNGIYINGGTDHTKVRRNLIHDNTNNGIYALDSEDVEVCDNSVGHCLNGIEIATASPTITSDQHINMHGNTLFDNTEYGIHINPGVVQSIIGPHNTFSNNGLGAILDEGTDTYIDDVVRAQFVWDTNTSSPLPDSYGERLDVPVSSRAATGDAMSLAPNAVNDSAVAVGALTRDAFASDVDTYQAKVWFFDDNSGSTDRYTVIWYKNGEPVTTGITSPLIQVYKVADGTDLVAETAMTEIGSTGTYRYNEASNRLIDGVAYIAQVKATIASSQRRWFQPVGRDSS